MSNESKGKSRTGPLSFARWSLGLLLLFGVLGAAPLHGQTPSVSDQPVAVAHFTNINTGTHAILTSISIELGYFTSPFTPLANPLFGEYAFQPSDVGRTFTETATNQPNFAGFVHSLTDGTNELMVVQEIEGSSGGQHTAYESQFFSQLPPNGNGIDLQGFQISRITLQLNSLVLNSLARIQTAMGFGQTFRFREH